MGETMSWQLQEAKNKFSQVVADALRDGPQIITRHGTEVAVLLSYQEYKRVTESSRHAQTKLSQFFRTSPLADEELDFGRDMSEARVVLEL
jgi:antitoxin Phd